VHVELNAARDHAKQSSAKADLDIIGMGSEAEHSQPFVRANEL
jgi:hypothetical protein